MADEVRAGARSVAGDDVDRSCGEAHLGSQLREPQRRQRRLRVGLEHDGAAGGERGRELPRRHQQRVVPRHDLAGDADRLLQRVEEERPADGIRAAGDRGDRGGVEAEVLHCLDDLGLHRRDRLADVPRLELCELVAVREDRVGRARAGGASARWRRLAPRPPSAARAASTARSTSASPAIAALASGSPVAGSRSSRISPEAGSAIPPSMKRPYSLPVATAIAADDTARASAGRARTASRARREPPRANRPCPRAGGPKGCWPS